MTPVDLPSSKVDIFSRCNHKEILWIHVSSQVTLSSSCSKRLLDLVKISGEGRGILSLILKDTCLSKETELLKITGDQCQKWNKATVTVLQNFVPNDYSIILKADIRRSFHGSMAIDDVKISKGHCQD
ncbi:uncharacterized protein LOC128558089 [Mercenaria mercenaria]|uniref:uncharacterized protein LOC128558089 n=1 Tax=Mercenaria mercenaria TaxID=6596 RepID=UPI00234FB1D8|nr:uncharacterized protein LOC128558089 [Mercenaria mercenaria]